MSTTVRKSEVILHYCWIKFVLTLSYGSASTRSGLIVCFLNCFFGFSSASAWVNLSNFRSILSCFVFNFYNSFTIALLSSVCTLRRGSLSSLGLTIFKSLLLGSSLIRGITSICLEAWMFLSLCSWWRACFRSTLLPNVMWVVPYFFTVFIGSTRFLWSVEGISFGLTTSSFLFRFSS